MKANKRLSPLPGLGDMQLPARGLTPPANLSPPLRGYATTEFRNRNQLSVLANNLGIPWRWLVLPRRIESWSLTSLQQRLVKRGGPMVKHARYYWLPPAERRLTRRLFGAIVSRIAA